MKLKSLVLLLSTALSANAFADDKQVKKSAEMYPISQSEIILNLMNQNEGRSLEPIWIDKNWTKFFRITGGLNVDMGKFGNRNQNFMGENYQRISLNDFYLNIAADVNEWVDAFASLSFANSTTRPDDLLAFPGEYSAAYSNNIQGPGINFVQLEQAYLTIANFDRTPIFLQVGKQFQEFGRYDIHPITRTLAQVMTETLATSAKIGFIVPMGLHGSLFVFDDSTAKVGKKASTTNGGASLGFDSINDLLSYGFGASYLINLYGVNDIAYQVNNFTLNTNYNKRVAGLAIHADVQVGPFGFSARYVDSLRRFALSDLPQYGVAQSVIGAKPWAFDLQADFTFNHVFAWWYKKQMLLLGYQASKEAAGLRLPKHRWVVGYNIEALANTNFAIEWDRDTDYPVGVGGAGNTSNLVTIRASVLF